ncbi:MAG: GNAT family N-acetyltransferase [Notoacmeibacter sp.]
MMAAIPIFEEARWSAAGPMVAGLAGFDLQDPNAPLSLETRGEVGKQRRFSVYPASAAFHLSAELEHLSYRAIEPNIYFNPRFLAPAMPRLNDKDVRLAVLRDDAGKSTRLRLVMPYVVERPVIGVGPNILRSWANVFGPNGTPLIDCDDPAAVADEFLEILSRPHLGLPSVLVIPQAYSDGAAGRVLRTAALARDFPVFLTQPHTRAVLASELSGEDYIKTVFSSHHGRGYSRLLRRLEEHGTVSFSVARDRDSVFRRLEEFLLLEMRGWKGRNRTALTSDRLHAAFAREAINGMADRDMVRIVTLDINGKAIASLLVMIESGTAYTWKIAYDEAFSNYSPGMLLMIEATKLLLDDPNVTMADSCAVPNHPMMDRVWSERRELQTIVIGLGTQTDRLARQAFSQIELYDRTRTVARSLRDRLKSWFG